jgi:hypothetical protein
MSSSNNKTSLLVSGQLPAFVREEHETFIKFMEYYYKSLEQDGETLYLSKNMLRNLDIDQLYRHVLDVHTNDQNVRDDYDYITFLQKMYDTFIKYIPDNVLADRTNILKHAKEFYLSAGSESSIRFLVQALFNKQATLYYPKTDILRASDGKWFIEKSLRVRDVKINNVSNTIAATNFANTFIKGVSSNATAIVEKVDTYYDKGQLIFELKLSNIYKEFLNAEEIYTYYTDEGVDKYLTANLFSGIVTTTQIISGGEGYTEGTTVPIVSNTGTGAQIIISRVTKGTIQAAGVVQGGAGFKVNDPLLIVGSGSGAAGLVTDVDDSGFYHPNSYNVVWSTINLEANTLLSNLVYSNLNSSNVNTTIANAMSYFVYGNCGPAFSLSITNGGDNYIPPISIGISANSIITRMGILGKMQIIRPGTAYANGDLIVFENLPGSTGSGAQGFVNVNATGAIVTAKFKPLAGQITGGSGYDWFNLPRANVISTTGSGANIAVTAIIGQNEEIIQSVSNVGTIQDLTVVSGGYGYTDNPTLDLTGSGDGNAIATLSFVTGAYAYPGRYISDDGHISGYNFLEDRDYYQEFSYVVKVDETINKYRAAIKDLTHPAGMRLFGEYDFVFDKETKTNTNVEITYANTVSNTLSLKTQYQVQGFTSGTFAPNISVGMANAEFVVGSYAVNTSNRLSGYSAANNDIVISYFNSGYRQGDYVFLSFTGSNTWANLGNTNYTVTSANLSHFTVYNALRERSDGVANVGNVRVFNPDVMITMPYSRPSVGENVYIQFKTTDISLANGFYQVRDVKNVNTFNVLHPNMTTANDAANVANLITKKIVVTANSHGFVTGENTYILFLGGDTANTKNGYYTITSVRNGNTFNVTGQNVLFSGSTSHVYQKLSSIVITGHPHANGNSAYIAFTSGDQANTTNGVYYPIKISANEFRLNVAKPATANCGVRVWYQSNNYSNVRFTTLRTSNGFVANNNVYVEFYTSATDLANGIYMIKRTYSSNTYNIFYDANTYYYSAEYLATENLLTNANNIAGSPWLSSSVTATANAAISPDGSNTAANLTSTAADSYRYQTITGLVLNRAYTFSVWLKAPTSTNVAMSLVVRANTVAPYVADFISPNLNVTNTWKKFSLNFVANTSSATLFIGAYGSFSTPESVYAWGAQANTSNNILYYSGVGISNNSIMEGIAYVSPYK